MLSHLIKNNHVLREKIRVVTVLAGRGVGDYAEIPPLSGSRQSTPDENSASVFLSRKISETLKHPFVKSQYCSRTPIETSGIKFKTNIGMNRTN